MTPNPPRGGCSTSETIASLFLIGCAIAVVLVVAVGVAIGVYLVWIY